MKKILSVMLAIIIIASSTGAVFATGTTATKEDYLISYNEYKELYYNVYVPAYDLYNETFNQFVAEFITPGTADSATVEFYNYLVAKRADFFGDRQTPTKSRYDVPALREQMYAAASAGDYNLAIEYCALLRLAVQVRIDFLTGLRAELTNYVASLSETDPQPSDVDVDAQFNITTSTATYHEFSIVINNRSNEPVSAWTLEFNYDGVINNIWVDGSALNRATDGSKTTLSPANEWQQVYTIPANSSIVLSGNGSAPGTDVWGAKFMSNDIVITFTAPQPDPEPEVPEVPVDSDVNIVFRVLRDTPTYHEFSIVLTNTTDQPISNWTFEFDYNGAVSNIWAAGSSLRRQINGNHISLAPENQWQAVYTIPANGSIELLGNGSSAAGTAVTNAIFMGNPFQVVFAGL